MDPGDQLRAGIGLLDEARPSRGREGGLVVAARNDYGGVGPDLVDVAEGLDAVHRGHEDVEQHETDPIGHAAEDVDRLGSVARQDRRVPGPLQRHARHFPDLRLVVHHQDHPMAAHLRLRRALDFRWGELRGGRQQHGEARSFSRAGLHGERAAVSAHDPEHRREAQPAARELGGEERL